MFILGHLGVTLAAFFLASLAIPSIRRRLDYRFIALGALLPDLIDKPVGRLLFAESVASGRLVAHTLVFVIVMFFVGYALYRLRGESRVVQVAGACGLHLVEDRMWESPATLLWPMLGWGFPEGNHYGSFLDYLLNITTLSYVPELSFVFVAEVFGVLVLGVMFVRYWWTLQGR
ncbi:MAG: metal-dependent hydrolase [Thermodesulfobacteriota bacterium]|nr:metal-dependent hydrolase [Thermodesulfobacteriota bacterium]